MAKSASQVAEKYAMRASAASGDYVEGSEQTTKDQAAAAIAAKEIYKQAVAAAANEGRYEKGLQKSGKTGWLNGIRDKGGNRYSEGVSQAAPKYATNSARFDTARNTASGMPRGLKGSPQNMQRVTATVNALIAAKKSA